MEFKFIENVEGHENEKYIYNLYGDKQGKIKTNYEVTIYFLMPVYLFPIS